MIGYVDCFSGASGNMLLGALLDAGLSLDELKTDLAALPVGNYHFKYERSSSYGITGVFFDIELEEATQPHRHLADIIRLLDSSRLSEQVRTSAKEVFTCLAQAEAAVHGSRIEEVHFHEVGAVDALIDIVGFILGLERLGVQDLYCSALPLGSGQVNSTHGILPVPAPATLQILSQVQAPLRPSSAETELVTPTGAALLATLATFCQPAFAIQRTGYGFGHKQLPWPNCTRILLGESTASQKADEAMFEHDLVTIIETNLDTTTGEILGHLMELLFQQGALDVTYTPVFMKKNRPATQVTVIAAPELASRLSATILRETTSLGVRLHDLRRLKAGRRSETISTPYGPVRVKHKLIGGRMISSAPEYDDCHRIALEQKIPLAAVYATVEKELSKTNVAEYTT